MFTLTEERRSSAGWGVLYKVQAPTELLDRVNMHKAILERIIKK